MANVGKNMQEQYLSSWLPSDSKKRLHRRDVEQAVADLFISPRAIWNPVGRAVRGRSKKRKRVTSFARCHVFSMQLPQFATFHKTAFFFMRRTSFHELL